MPGKTDRSDSSKSPWLAPAFGESVAVHVRASTMRSSRQGSTETATIRSSSQNAISNLSARTMKHFPSPRCASAIQIVRPSESRVDTQPQHQPNRLEVIAGSVLTKFLQLRVMRFCRSVCFVHYHTLEYQSSGANSTSLTTHLGVLPV